mgnify:CR=1 FL=1
MNDKELLQKIKNVRTAVKEIYGNVNTITYPIYMVDWLIEQAEKIQRYQESYSGLDKMYDHWRNKAKELEKQLQQAQAKAERYKNHLLYIQKHYGLPSEPTDFVPVTVLHEIQMIVNNALEVSS